MQGRRSREDQSSSVSQESFQIFPLCFHTGGPFSQSSKRQVRGQLGSRRRGREETRRPFWALTNCVRASNAHCKHKSDSGWIATAWKAQTSYTGLWQAPAPPLICYAICPWTEITLPQLSTDHCPRSQEKQIFTDFLTYFVLLVLLLLLVFLHDFQRIWLVGEMGNDSNYSL